MISLAKQALEPKAEAAAEKAAKELAREREIPIERACLVIASSSRGELLSWDSVHFDDDELGVVTVADILNDPARYHDLTLADPIEGRAYGTGKAKLFYNGGGDVRIHSFAHGSGHYKLCHCPDYIAREVEKAGEEAPNVLARLIPFDGALDAVKSERLRNLAARVGKVGKVGKRAVNKVVNKARARAKAEVEAHRARNAPCEGDTPRDARQKFVLRAGQRPTALVEINKALRIPAHIKAGAILVRGQIPVVLRFAADPVKLRDGSAEVELPAGSAYLAPAKPEHVQAQCDQLFAFHKINGNGEEYSVDLSSDLARYTLANGNFLPVTSISRTPVLLRDGTVLETPGYDPRNAIYYAPDTNFPPVPEKPTKKDAEAALKRLRLPFRAFPFVTEADRDAVVAEILTIVSRHLVPRAPAFVHNAVEAGSGKSLLFNTVSAIAIGTPAPLLNAEVLQDETELRKQLTTLTLGAAPLAIFDNTVRGEMLNSAGLANFLTAELYGDRLLGANTEVRAPTTTVVGITGNAIEIAGDLTRRTIRVDLDAGCARPETRHFNFDPEAEARQDRAELVVAALTIFRAHALAGWPQVKNRAMLGSFEDWDRLVVNAIIFAGGEDIVDLMNKTRSVDPERDQLAELIDMLEGVGAVEGKAKTTREIIAAVRKLEANRLAPMNPNKRVEEWMAIVQQQSRDGAPDPTRFGRFLGKNAGRIESGRRLVRSNDKHAKVARYHVQREPADE